MEPNKAEITVLIIVLLVIMFMIRQTYVSNVTTRTYLINLYLYILFTIISIVLGAEIFKTMNIIKPEKTVIFVIAYLLISFLSIFLIFSDNKVTSHAGLLLFIVMQSVLLSIPFKISTNVNEALITTFIIFAIITAIAFALPTETLLKTASWIPSLVILLCGVIIAELLFLLFSSTETIQKYQKFFNIFVIGLFSFFILADTSVVILRSKVLNVKSLYDLNFPKDSVGLSLDYLNIFIRLLNNK